MKIKKTVKGIAVGLSLPLVVYIFFAALRPTVFLTGFSIIYTIINQSISVAILAWGMQSEMAIGTTDFSLAAEMILYEVCAVIFYNTFGLVGMIAGTALLALLFGLLKAFIKDLVQVHSLVLGIGLTYVIGSVGALVAMYTKSTGIINTNILATFPYNFLILIVSGVVMWFIRTKSTFGAQINAVGGNSKIAGSAGINERKVAFKASLLASLFTGVAALFALNRGGGIMNKAGLDSLIIIFDALMCVFVSICLKNYIESTLGIFIGAVTMNILGIGLVSVGLDSELNDTVTSSFLLILLAVMTISGYIAQDKSRRELADNRIKSSSNT